MRGPRRWGVSDVGVTENKDKGGYEGDTALSDIHNGGRVLHYEVDVGLAFVKEVRCDRHSFCAVSGCSHGYREPKATFWNLELRVSQQGMTLKSKQRLGLTVCVGTD